MPGSVQPTEAAPSAAHAEKQAGSTPPSASSAVQIHEGRCALEDVSPQELRRLESWKLEALAEFAAGAGHEINNPVAVISGRAAMLLREETDPERRRLLATIGAQALRIRDMIGDLMLFARPPQPAPESLDLRDVARTVVARFTEELPPGVELSVSGAESVPVWADRAQLCVVVESLVRNSIEALQDAGGRIEVEAHAPAHRASADLPCPASLLVVRDTGPGLSDADREHLFDPFYSGRQAGRGLGFGLCKCWRIVTQHGGRIEVESGPGGPTAFRVFWPAEPPAPPGSAGGDDSSGMPSAG